MGERTDKVSTLCLKAARTAADMEPAKPPRRGHPVAQVPPRCAGAACPRTAAITVGAAATGDLQPSTDIAINSIIHISIRPPASQRPAAKPTQTLSLPPLSLGGDLWWRTVCSSCVSRLDRHVTYYTSHMLYICTYSPLAALAEIHSSSPALNVFTSLPQLCLNDFVIMPNLRRHWKYLSMGTAHFVLIPLSKCNNTGSPSEFVLSIFPCKFISDQTLPCRRKCYHVETFFQ
jgi:hypothetical protein